MAKDEAGGETKAPPEIELAHTGEDALARLREFARVVVNVPKSEIVEAELSHKMRRKPH